MIITVPIMVTLGACQEGIDEGVALGLEGMEYNLAIQTLKNNNQNEFAAWLITQKGNIILLNPNPVYGSYRLFNLIKNNYDFFATLPEAQTQLALNKQEYVINQKDRFSVNQDIDNPDGTVTWVSVDPFTFDQEDDYQVFNTFTGQYTAYDNLADAQAAQKAIEKQVGDLVPGIQQQITSSDKIETETAWINIE